MHITFVEQDFVRQALLPLTYTKSVYDLRVGILTMKDKWLMRLGTKEYSVLSFEEACISKDILSNNLFVNTAVFPTNEIVKAVLELKEGDCLKKDGNCIAFKGTSLLDLAKANSIEYHGKFSCLDSCWNMIHLNAFQLIEDYKLITTGRTSENKPDKFSKVYNPNNVFLEEGAEVRASILNAEAGPIYIGKNAKVHEGSIIKGPFALCEGATVVMGSKIREGCTIGVKATAGGELKNSIIGDYSNKGHEGYLGDSVIGSWCNLGALTNISNLKNTYSTIRIHDCASNSEVNTGLLKLGCIMGDYVHTGISTTINTGTVVSPFCQLFGVGLHEKFIPAFTWGQQNNYTVYQLEKLLEVVKKIHATKGEELTENKIKLIESLYQLVQL